MTENRFEGLLATHPQTPAGNRFADLRDRADALQDVRNDPRHVDGILGMGDQLELPVAEIEDLYPALAQDRDFYGIKLPAHRAGEITPLAAPDPSDPFAVKADPLPDIRIGLREQVARMDAVDWAKRFPFSPAGLFHSADLMAAARRLKLDVYEDEFRADYDKADSTEGRMQAGTKPRVIALPAERRAQDIATVEEFLLRQQEVSDRGQTWGAQVFAGASYMPAWMLEFALTGGLAKLGSETAKEIGLKTLQGYATTKGGQAALKAAGWTGGVITRATLGMPHRLGEEISERRIQSLALQDGQIIQVNPENWASSILKGYASHLINVGSESAGEAIAPATTWVTRNTLGRLPFASRLYDGLRDSYLAMHGERGAAAAFADRFFDAAKYDGLLGELGEERLATVLHAIVGTETFGLGEDSSPIERLKAGLAQDFKTLPVELAVLAVPGAVRVGAEMVVDRTRTSEAAEFDSFDLLADVAALDAMNAARTFLGAAPEPDLTVADPSTNDVGFARQLLHNLGIRSKDGYQPFEDRDFREFWKFVQMPDDIRRSFPQFDPIYQVERAREIQKQVLDQSFATMAKPYFDLTAEEQSAVDAALVEAERNPDGPAVTVALSEKQKAGFMAIRESLNRCADMLIEEMRLAGVDEKAIEDFARTIRNYIPHKWYGDWAVVVKDPITPAHRAHGITRNPAIFMTAVGYTDRFKERDRLQSLYPNQVVSIVKRNEIEFEAFQEAPPWAVSRMVDLVQEKAKARLSQHANEVLHETLSDLYKSKGFGMHYIRRRNIPGYSEDLRRPLAEYLAGFSGYITKMRAMKQFTEALQGIHPQRTPKLYKYALEYVRYVTGDPMEFASLKKGLYAWYLYGNIKSASLNLTQNLMLGWPVLSRHTKFPLAKLLTAMGRTAAGRLNAGERQFLSKLEAAGYLDPQMSQEISGRAGNAVMQQIQGPIGKAISYGDVFKHMEGFNRKAMAVALYNAGVTDLNQAAELIDEAHFRYSKGNRPVLSRGYLSPLMTFRSWNINYLTWLKNQIKARDITPMAKSLTAWILLGGVRALPGMAIVSGLYASIFQRDLEGDAREALGQTADQILFRGLPSEANVSFTGSVGMGDVIPTDLTSLGGVAAGIPDRVKRVFDDLSTGQYLRALEDAAPEVLRNPLSARRLYVEGARDRSGRPILDLDSMQQLRLTRTEAIMKSLGFAPDRLRQEWDLRDTLDAIHTQRQGLKSNWADRLILATIDKDTEQWNDVLDEWRQYNAKAADRGREDLIIPDEELDQALSSRLAPLNLPPESEWPTEARIRSQFRKE